MYYELLETYGYVDGLIGVNEDGENVMVTIDENEATLSTLQNNGWIRVNTYYPDGTQEEMYRR